MKRRNSPLNLQFLDQIKFDEDSPDLEIVQGNSGCTPSCEVALSTDSESKYSEWTSTKVVEQVERYNKILHQPALINNLKDGGRNIIDKVKELEREKARRELRRKKAPCQSKSSTSMALQPVHDGKDENTFRYPNQKIFVDSKIQAQSKTDCHVVVSKNNEAAGTSICLEIARIQRKQCNADSQISIQKRKQEQAQNLLVDRMSPHIEACDSTFEDKLSNSSAASGLSSRGGGSEYQVGSLHCSEHCASSSQKHRCNSLNQRIRSVPLQANADENKLFTPCQRRVCSSPATFLPALSQESLDTEVLYCSPGESSLGRAISSKRGHTATIGESPDMAMEVSDDEDRRQVKDSVTAPQSCSRNHPKRQGLRSTSRWKEGLKIAYPDRNDPEAVEVLYSDLQHLEPSEFLNDTIIDFYIKYIQRPDFLSNDKKRISYFFNSFFYKKLLLGKKRTKVLDPFSKMRKWTKGINIFTKVYLLVPIHDSAHWSLAIICFAHSGDIVLPHILHLDSMSSGHASEDVFRVLKSYLESEWKYTLQADATNPTRPKICLANTIQKRVQVPLQENEWDCGLFLLYYIECFVQNAPLQLTPSNLANMFGRLWFKPEEASNLRYVIQALLKSLFEREDMETQTCRNTGPLEVYMEDMD
eukprot:c23037_g1_i1 orf=128-2059(+)